MIIPLNPLDYWFRGILQLGPDYTGSLELLSATVDQIIFFLVYKFALSIVAYGDAENKFTQTKHFYVIKIDQIFTRSKLIDFLRDQMYRTFT